MRDTLRTIPASRAISADAKGRSLHALGCFYLRQGFPKQGLSLLLAAKDYDLDDATIDRAIAHAYLLCGAPKQTLQLLDALEDAHAGDSTRNSAAVLRSRALLALGRVDEARDLYSMTTAIAGDAR
jgi:hypothetical protein